MKVLVVDDHAGFRNMVRKQLMAEWPEAAITDCDPSAQGLTPDNYDGADFDLVLLDYQLGPQNGFDYLKRFRTIPNFPPVIMLTGEGNERLAVDAIKLGAADYIPKQSMTQEILIKAMREALDARGTVQRYEQSEARPAGVDPTQIRVKDLKVVRKLAEGGMSSIFLAERVRGGAQVVLKVFDQAKAMAHDPEGMYRFSQEYEILRRLNHPNIVRIFEQGFTDDHAYITMEYLPGGSLRELFDSELPPAQALRIAAAIADALEAVHEAGVVHRDLKPGNVMFREDGSLALIDFGVAKQLQNALNLTHAGIAIGTPHYISPEQVDGLRADARSDLYALGVILFEMLTGCVPYSARTAMAVLYKHKHAPVPVLAPSQARFQPLVDRFLAKDPAVRFQSVAELRPALATAARN